MNPDPHTFQKPDLNNGEPLLITEVYDKQGLGYNLYANHQLYAQACLSGKVILPNGKSTGITLTQEEMAKAIKL